jgi:predicted  nucleic acid-binding Zn-ribbon protein
MKGYPFRTFIDLIQFDQETQSLQQDLRILGDEIEELESKKQQFILMLEEAKNAIVSLKKEVDSNELTMKELDQIEAEKKKKIDGVSSQREYKSIQAELAAINRKQRAVEERLVDLWNKYEAAQKQCAAQQEEHSNRMKELDEEITKKKTNIATIMAAVEKREKDRLALEKELPEEWLEKYAVMRMRVANPVVPVVREGSCSACFYPIPRQDILLLKAGKLVQCKSCYRLLYIKPEEQEEKEETVANEQEVSQV